MSGQFGWAHASGALRRTVDAFFEPHTFSPGWKDDQTLCRICERKAEERWHTEKP